MRRALAVVAEPAEAHRPQQHPQAEVAAAVVVVVAPAAAVVAVAAAVIRYPASLKRVRQVGVGIQYNASVSMMVAAARPDLR